MFSAMDAEHLRVPMNISHVTVGSTANHPVILPTDFVVALDGENRLDLLLPDPSLEKSKQILTEYWRRFRLQFGCGHEAISMLSPEKLALTVPCKVHGDEGRSSLSVGWQHFSRHVLGLIA